MVLLTAIILGFVLDLLFGDPRWLPHPICFIGKLISATEKVLRRFTGEKPEGLLMGGFMLVVIVLGVSFAVPYFILHFAEMYSPVLAFIIETFMFYQIFAMRSLKEAAMQVCEALQAGDLPEARKKLSWIVGRDTAELTEEEVAKAAVETVAENTSDGVIAPMLFMFIGGAPLAFLYKAINTMDSMVGYKNDKYLYFGRCAARLDDVANFIPARVSGLLMVAAAYFLNMDAAGSWRIFKRDRRHHLSPNSAMTESAAAGALGIKLGGGHFYFGKWVPKDTIGDELKKTDAGDIVKMNGLMYMTCILSILSFSLVYLIKIFLIGE